MAGLGRPLDVFLCADFFPVVQILEDFDYCAAANSPKQQSLGRWVDGLTHWKMVINEFIDVIGNLVGGLEHFLFSHILGIIIPID